MKSVNYWHEGPMFLKRSAYPSTLDACFLLYPFILLNLANKYKFVEIYGLFFLHCSVNIATWNIHLASDEEEEARDVCKP